MKSISQSKPVVWVDFENAPHVWVLSPIIDYLKKQGYPVFMTARDFSYTLGLCQRLGHPAEAFGLPGFGKNKLDKTMRLVLRAVKLYAYITSRRVKTIMALSHGSRSQILAARLLGIKIISMDDYEHSDQSVVRLVNYLLVPFPIPKEHWGKYAERVQHYPGLKEELYLSHFVHGEGLPELNNGRVKVLFRPEGRTAHYQSQQSFVLDHAILEFLSEQKHVLLVLLPRDARQTSELTAFCKAKNITYLIPESVVDGPQLIWQMDLVVGGGGTMTREAAVLGVPAYSFFGGPWGAVDQYLKSKGWLTQISQPTDVNRIQVARRQKQAKTKVSNEALEFVTGFIQKQIDGAN